MNKLAPYSKAILGAAIAALTTLAGYLLPGSKAAIAVAVALAFLVALGGVYAVPNKPQRPMNRKLRRPVPDAGHAPIHNTIPSPAARKVALADEKTRKATKKA